MRALLLVTGLALFAGCGPTATSQSRIPSDELVMGEKAKAALVELVRSDRNLFIGNPDPDILAGLRLENCGNHEFGLGRFIINVEKRQYQATIGLEGPEPYHYYGSFEVHSEGRWHALRPELQRFHRMSP